MFPSIVESGQGQAVALTFSGDFDLSNRDELESACRRVEAYEPGRRLYVDLAGVRYIDCASLRIIAETVARRHDLGDPASLVVPSPFVRRLLTLAGVPASVPVLDGPADVA